MQLQIEIKDTNSSMFLKLLETFKVGNIVNSYSIISDAKEKETRDMLEEIAMLDTTKDSKSASSNFHKNINIKIRELIHFPYKYRESIYFDSVDTLYLMRSMH